MKTNPFLFKVKLHTTHPIGKTSVGYQDFIKCKIALDASPDIVHLIFGNINRPCRPKPLNQIDLSPFSPNERTKIKLGYAIWSEHPLDLSMSDLCALSEAERQALAKYLIKPTR